LYLAFGDGGHEQRDPDGDPDVVAHPLHLQYVDAC